MFVRQRHKTHVEGCEYHNLSRRLFFHHTFHVLEPDTEMSTADTFDECSIFANALLSLRMGVDVTLYTCSVSR
jgi:hypothetical protein